MARRLQSRAAGGGAIAALLATLALGCGVPDVVTRTADYRAEVEVAAGREAPGDDGAGERFYPRLRDRRLPVAEERIGFLDFLTIQGCRLGELAGYRNSPLGRVMVPTRRLGYEVEVLMVAASCLPTLDEGDDELRMELVGLIQRKQRELPRHVWNALWTNEELASYLVSEMPPQTGRWDRYASDALSDLGLALASPPNSVEATRRIEATLGELRNASPGGGLLRALDRVGSHLDAIAQVLEGQQDAECSGANRRLTRVFEARYLTLQPELTALDREARSVIVALAALYHRTEAPVAAAVPAAMQRYGREQLDLDAPDALWSTYRRGVVRHARAWAPVLASCGRLPGA